MNSIYGQLIELHEGGKIVPDLASGYTFETAARPSRSSSARA